MRIVECKPEHRWRAVQADMEQRGISNSAFGYEDYMEKVHGYENKRIAIRIGGGTHVHRAFATCKVIDSALVVAGKVMSLCGSQKWTSGGYSTIMVVEDTDDNVTCRKCNRNAK